MSARTISGYAVVWGDIGTVTTDKSGLKYREIFAAGSFDGVDMSKTTLNINHRGTPILARTSDGSLSLSVDEVGLRFVAEMPTGAAGDRALADIRAGVYTGASVCFGTEQDSWYRQDGELPLRLVERVAALAEVSLANNPTYGLTIVGTTRDAGTDYLADMKRRKSRGGRTLSDVWRIGSVKSHPLNVRGTNPMPRPANAPKLVTREQFTAPTPAQVATVTEAMSFSRAAMSGYASLAASRGLSVEEVRKMAVAGRLAEVVRMLPGGNSAA